MPDNLRLRVALAHSLAAGPRFLLLDDPFRALEISARHEMQEYLLRIWKHYGTGMLIATPDVAEGLFMATDLVLMTGDPVHIELVRRLDYGRRALAGESTRAIRNDPSFKRLHDDIEAEFFTNPRRVRSNNLIDRPGELR